MLRVIGLFLSLLTLFGCDAGADITDSLEAVTLAADNARLLENGTYTNWVKQSVGDESIENITEGTFIKKDHVYDWYTKLVLTDEGENPTQTMSETLQIDGVRRNRYRFLDAAESTDWGMVSDTSNDEPANLFFRPKNLPLEAQVEAIAVTAEAEGTVYTFKLNQAYADTLAAEGIAVARAELEEAEQNEALTDTIPALEENLRRVAAMSYENITMTFTVDRKNILIHHQTSMDLALGDEANTVITNVSGTRIDRSNINNIEEYFPQL